MESEYLYERKYYQTSANALSPQTSKISGLFGGYNHISIFPVPQDNAVGSNDMGNAITIISFPKGKIDYDKYFRNAKDISGSGKYLPPIHEHGGCMKKISLIALLLNTLFGCSMFSKAGDIKCALGDCKGWTGHYETIGGFSEIGGISSGKAKYIFTNNTDKPASNVTIIITFHDSSGRFITMLRMKKEGPLHSPYTMRGPLPKEASEVTFQLYVSEELQPGHSKQ
jgi:hypothetical protein